MISIGTMLAVLCLLLIFLLLALLCLCASRFTKIWRPTDYLPILFQPKPWNKEVTSITRTSWTYHFLMFNIICEKSSQHDQHIWTTKPLVPLVLPDKSIIMISADIWFSSIFISTFSNLWRSPDFCSKFLDLSIAMLMQKTQCLRLMRLFTILCTGGRQLADAAAATTRFYTIKVLSVYHLAFFRLTIPYLGSYYCCTFGSMLSILQRGVSPAMTLALMVWEGLGMKIKIGQTR